MVREAANILVKGEFDGQELIAGLQEVSKLGKKAASDSNLVNAAMGNLSNTMSVVGGDVKEAIGIISQGFDNLEKKLNSQKQSFDRLSSSIDKTKKQYKEFNSVQKQASAIADKMTGDNTRGAAQANRFNSANFLAQFQDIAVTSAMGMNPLLIAMQQGTQLQYILAQSTNPLKDFVAGLKSAFSVVGLVTIGLTAIIAALIQMVNWTKVAQTVLRGLASAFTWLGDKLNLGFLSRLGDYFKELAGNIGLAKEVLEDWNKALSKIDLEIENKEFEASLENLTTYEREYKKAFRELQLIYAESQSKLIAKGGTEEDFTSLEKKLATIPEEAERIAKRNTKIIEAAEAKKKEKQALEDAAKAAKKDTQAVERLAQAWDRLQISSQNKIQDLQMNISLVGASNYEKTYEQTLNDLKHQAEGANIDLYGPDNKYEQLEKDAEGIARLTEEYEKLNDKVDFSKSTIKGFFSDMRHGLRDGQSAWEAFGNAVNNVLDKILDKIMDIGVDALFNIGYGYGKTSGWWGASGQQVYSSPIGPTMPGATPLTGAANGGVFSNGIYSSPTLFKFAKGGKFGVMGEAGPEAVMPLKRAPDGSLGVQADSANNSPVIVNVINNSNAQAKVEQRQTSQGIEIDVMIDQLVAEKMNQPGTSSNSALRAFNNQKLIAR